MREVTVESWSLKVSAVNGQQYGNTYQPATKNIRHRRRHVDIFPHDVIRADSRHLVLRALSFAPYLLPYHPDPAIVRLGVILGRVMGDHEFQPLHRPQPALESLSSLDDVVHVGVVERLRSQGGIVGSRVEKGGFGEVGKDCERHSTSWGEALGKSFKLVRTSVGVDAAHFLCFGGSPLYLIQRRLLRHRLGSVVKVGMRINQDGQGIETVPIYNVIQGPK